MAVDAKTALAQRENLGGTPPELAVETVIDNLGNLVAIGSLPQTLGYDGAGNLTTVTATDGVSSWVQTMTYTSGRLTSVSQWVKQP